MHSLNTYFEIFVMKILFQNFCSGNIILEILKSLFEKTSVEVSLTEDKKVILKF